MSPTLRAPVAIFDKFIGMGCVPATTASDTGPHATKWTLTRRLEVRECPSTSFTFIHAVSPKWSSLMPYHGNDDEVIQITFYFTSDVSLVFYHILSLSKTIHLPPS
jgi:hypothetical protein